MYFSGKQLTDYLNRDNMGYARSDAAEYAGVHGVRGRRLTLKEGRAINRKYHDSIYNRDPLPGGTKWFRPWHVVPELSSWVPSVGEYGVGVEIEMGFTSRNAAIAVCEKFKKWKHVTFDFEGGAVPIEATFPPTSYATFSRNSKPHRYIKFLRENSSFVVNHGPERCVGTHVNVSKRGANFRGHTSDRAYAVGSILQSLSGSAVVQAACGRRPYGYCYPQNSYIEYKLFNSTTDADTLTKYVNVGVSLTELILSDRTINSITVTEALNAGISGSIRKTILSQ